MEKLYCQEEVTCYVQGILPKASSAFVGLQVLKFLWPTYVFCCLESLYMYYLTVTIYCIIFKTVLFSKSTKECKHTVYASRSLYKVWFPLWIPRIVMHWYFSTEHSEIIWDVVWQLLTSIPAGPKPVRTFYSLFTFSMGCSKLIEILQTYTHIFSVKPQTQLCRVVHIFEICISPKGTYCT